MIALKDLFDLKYGVNLEFYKMEEEKNGIPFVSRQSVNNGVVGFVKQESDIIPNPANTISVACSGSVMASFFQEAPYYSGRDVYFLKPKVELTKKQLLYYCMCLRSNAYKYNYGRQANKTLGSIFVPSLENLPFWINEVNYPNLPINNPYNNLQIIQDTSSWKIFLYDDIFTIVRGESEYLINMNEGGYPYISTSSKNSGIIAYVDEFNHENNKITLSYDGTVGEAFYHTNRFFASEKIAVLDLKNYKLNKYIAMFLTTLIRLEQYRFNYGLKWSIESRMRKSIINLPVDSFGNPDWQFMEDYIKSLPYSKNLE